MLQANEATCERMWRRYHFLVVLPVTKFGALVDEKEETQVSSYLRERDCHSSRRK